MDWFDLLVVQGIFKSLLQHHNSKASSLWLTAFFMVQLLHSYMTTRKAIAFTIWTFVGKGMSLLFNMHSSQGASVFFFCLFVLLFKKNKFIYFNWRLIILQNCIGFAIHQHESTTCIHVFPIPNPPPFSLPVPSLWVVSVHQLQATSIMHRTWTGDSFHIHVSIPFSQIITPSPSPTESKRLFYISVSLL